MRGAFVWALGVSAAFGGTSLRAATPDYYRAVVQVRDWAPDGRVASGGSGTLVAVNEAGDQGIVLTCQHVIADHGARRCRVDYSWVRRDSSAVLIASDKSLDVAALWVAVPPGVRPIPLADRWPVQGESVQLCGYGGGRWKAADRRLLGYTTHGGSERTDVGISGESISGDSGGAILSFDENGQPALLGVLWGGPLAGPRGPMTATHGAHSQAIRAFIERACGARFPWACRPRGQPKSLC